MRRLTFSGYLEKYVRSLSFGETNNIYKLAGELSTNHRLREPLLLYALSVGKQDRLLRALNDDYLRRLYSDMIATYSWHDIIQALEENDVRLDSDYHKVYRSFISRRHMPETDAKVKRLMLSKIKDLQNSNNVSNYRVYKDLGLDRSNINSFLKHGDISKVSLDVARRMLVYLEVASL